MNLFNGKLKNTKVLSVSGSAMRSLHPDISSTIREQLAPFQDQQRDLKFANKKAVWEKRCSECGFLNGKGHAPDCFTEFKPAHTQLVPGWLSLWEEGGVSDADATQPEPD